MDEHPALMRIRIKSSAVVMKAVGKYAGDTTMNRDVRSSQWEANDKAETGNRTGATENSGKLRQLGKVVEGHVARTFPATVDPPPDPGKGDKKDRNSSMMKPNTQLSGRRHGAADSGVPSRMRRRSRSNKTSNNRRASIQPTSTIR